MAASKKRKVDTEYRIFNESWTDAFVFTFDTTSQKPTCLICQAIVAVNKAANLKRHHETKHSEFVANFPIGSEARKNKIQGLQASRTRQVQGLASFTGVQKRSTEVSLKINSILAKAMVPYSHGPIIKQCIQTACETLFPGNREVNQAVADLALSRKTMSLLTPRT